MDRQSLYSSFRSTMWCQPVERIGFLKEVVVEKIGRIRPVDEVEKHGHKTEVKTGERR